MPTVEDLGLHMEDDSAALNPEQRVPGHPAALLSQEDEDDDDLDETLGERLYGLREMFPEPVRNVTSTVVTSSWSLTKWLYHISRTGLWVFASSATVLALPAIFEKERIDLADMEIQQQREMLLGPNAAMAARGAPGMMAPPPLMQMGPPTVGPPPS